MHRRSCFLLLTLLLLVRAAEVHAQLLLLDSVQSSPFLGQYTRYLEDRSGALSIAEVHESNTDGQWLTGEKKSLNLGYSASAFWLRVEIKNLTPAKRWMLAIKYPLLDDLQVYVYRNGVLAEEYRSGDSYIYGRRPIDNRNFIFPLQISDGQKILLYVRVQSKSALALPMVVSEEGLFYSSDVKTVIIQSFLFGILVLTALHSILLAITLNHRVHWLFTIFIMAMLIQLMHQYGYSYQYFWPQGIWWQNNGIPLMSALSASSCCLFIIEYIKLNASNGLLYRAFQLLALMFPILCLLAVAMPNFIVIPYVHLLLQVLAAIAVSACAAQWYRGVNLARFFGVGITSLSLAIVLWLAQLYGIIDDSLFIQIGLELGLIVTFLVLSYGLTVELVRERERSEKIKDQFMVAISHELRTPMNAIFGGIQMEELNHERELPPEQEMIKTGAVEMMQLVNDIIIYTEMVADSVELRPRNITLPPLLSSLYKRYEELSINKQLDFEWDCDESIPQWLYLDDVKFSVILQKLLDNAFKFTSKGGIRFHLSLRSTNEGNFLECQLSDSGVGIVSDDQEKIFHSFRQAEGGLQRSYSGLGTGLFICRYLVEVMGGKLSLQSELGKGTTFTVTIPLIEGKEPLDRQIEQIPTVQHPVLVVEDNLVNQQVIEKMLLKLGYSSIVVGQGKDALELLDRETVSMILMDLQMPIMDGFSCTEAIRAGATGYKNIPIVAVTANLRDRDKSRCFSTGMNDYIEKPVKMNELESILHRYIGRPHSTTVDFSAAKTGKLS